MAQLHSVPTLQKPTLSAQVARHLLDLISREGLRPATLVPERSADLQAAGGQPRQRARGVPDAGRARHPGNRKRSSSAPAAISAHVLAQVFGYALKTAQVNATHVIETRRAIEVQGAQLAARNVTEAQKRLPARAGRPDALGARRARSCAPRQPPTWRFTRRSRKRAAIRSTPLLLAALRAPLEQVMDIDLGNRRSESELIRIVDAHEAIVERVCAGDAVGAGAAMAMHFDLSVGSISTNEHAARHRRSAGAVLA